MFDTYNSKTCEAVLKMSMTDEDELNDFLENYCIITNTKWIGYWKRTKPERCTLFSSYIYSKICL